MLFNLVLINSYSKVEINLSTTALLILIISITHDKIHSFSLVAEALSMSYDVSVVWSRQ